MHTKLQNTAYYLQVVFLALVIGIGLQIASAWTPPNSAPPTQSVSAPITTSAVSQSKLASLNLTGNLGAFEVQINSVVTEGSACPATGRIARDTNGVILSCQSGTWTKAGGSTSATALTSYDMLPTGTTAGRCYQMQVADGMTDDGPREPAYWNLGLCKCRAGFSLSITSQIGGGSLGSKNTRYACIKD